MYYRTSAGEYYQVKVASSGGYGGYGSYNFYYTDSNNVQRIFAYQIGSSTSITKHTYQLYQQGTCDTYEKYVFSYVDADGQTVTKTYGPTDSLGIGTAPSYYIPYSSVSSGNSGTRAEALKNAVAIFAEQVAAKAKGADGQYGGGDDVAHNVAIVAFAGYDKDITGVYVGDEIRKWNDGSISADDYEGAFQDMSTVGGVNNVKTSIGMLSNAQGTATFAGTAMANGILAAYNDPERYVQNGKTIRNKVVVIFTDGEPYGGLNDTDKYNVPIANANVAKATYGATVYTVGVLDNGNTKIPPGNNDKLNKLMHYMSSNYQGATNLNYNRNDYVAEGYYLLASNADDLNNIFSTISESVNSSQSVVQLNETTEVRDVISPYFKLPDGVQTSAIKVYTSKYLGGDNWGAYVPFALEGNKPIAFEKVEYKDENDKTVPDKEGNPITMDVLKVTGFDFAEHWVGPVVNNGVTTYHGDKLIIEFPVEVNPDFLGGSNVITNGAESGIYGEKGSESGIDKEEVDIYNQPSANEKVKPIKAPVRDRHVYSGSTIDLTDILDLHIVEGNSDKPLAEIANGINNDYVNITYTITFKNGVVAKYHIPAGRNWNDGEWRDVANKPAPSLGSVLVDGDMEFEVDCVMQDINDTENTSEIHDAKGYIYAWTPVITFKDSVKAPFADKVNFDSENRDPAVSSGQSPQRF